MKLTREQVIKNLKNGQSLHNLPKWSDDKDVVLEAVKQNVNNIKYISNRLKNDKDIVLEAVKHYSLSLKYTLARFKNDKDVVLEAVKKDGRVLRYASEQLRDDRDSVLAAVRSYGYSLKYASERLRDDKEIVLEAIKRDGWILVCASERLRKELLPQMLTSLNYKGRVEPIELVKFNGKFLCLLTREEKNNKEIVLEAIKQDIDNYDYASKEIRDKIDNNNPVQFLEWWIKSERQQEWLNRQLDKKENKGKIKI